MQLLSISMTSLLLGWPIQIIQWDEKTPVEASVSLEIDSGLTYVVN